MWQTREFKTAEQLRKWIRKNESKTQYEVLFIENGYAVEYRKLRRAY